VKTPAGLYCPSTGAIAKTALMSSQPRFTISGYMAKHRSDEPEYLRQMNTHVLPGLRKAGVPE